MKRIFLYITFIAVFCTLFSGCAPKSSADMFRREFYSMDTVIVIRIPSDSGISETEAERAFDAAEAAFEDIAIRTSRYCVTDAQKAESEVWRINENAGIAPVAVSDDVFYLIETALYYGEITDGKFNIAMGAITDLWGFSTDEYRVPSGEEIEETLKLCRLSDVVLNHESRSVYLKTMGMKLDLGALAKGYAADVLSGVLKENGAASAIVDAGGNVSSIGRKADSSKWTVGVQNPRELSNIIGTIQASDESVVSSGDYQRYFEQDGVRYCHIFDPDTGYPAVGAAASCVIYDDGLVADILSTTAFTMGEDGMREFTKAHDEFRDLAWLLIYDGDDGLSIVKSDAMEARFREE